MKNIAKSTIQEAYATLQTTTDFSPECLAVNTSLSNLVQCLNTVHTHADIPNDLAQDPSLAEEREHLPTLCSKAECEMEAFYAQRYIEKARLTFADIEEFIYFQQYDELCKKELDLMTDISTQPKRIIFLGSGPLPLSMIIMAKKMPDCSFVGIDIDATAISLSTRLCEKLLDIPNISFLQTSADEFNFKQTDFVICASLISHKPNVFNAMFENSVKHFIVRDAEQAYCYLYKPAETPEDYQYSYIASSTCNELTINTSKLYETQQNSLHTA